MNRRSFLALLGGLGASATLGNTSALAASDSADNKILLESSFGVLHDTTLCIGCRKCEEACATVNSLPKPQEPFNDLEVLNKKRRTTAKEWTVVNKYDQPDASKPVFRKSQCFHCNEPACATACFVKAFKKNLDGSVTYDPTLCVGCRYCMVACPFNIPGYTYHDALDPIVQKCTLCQPRLKEGKLPGCVEECPTGSLVFGKRMDLIRIAWERIKAHPDRYQHHVYGENEMGGTAWLTISEASFTSVGLDENLGTRIASDYTSGALGAVPMVIGIWPILLGGAYAISKRKEHDMEDKQKQAVKTAVEKVHKEAEAKLAECLEKAKKEKEQAIIAVERAEEDFKQGIKQLDTHNNVSVKSDKDTDPSDDT